MIKINLIAERKQTKTRQASPIKIEGVSGGRNIILAAVLIVGVAIAAGWAWSTNRELADWQQKHREADAEILRLEAIMKKGEEYKARKELLARKIDLITDLKKKQEVPVHILDQVSKNLPDFLWLDAMSANDDAISIAGKATTYNAVSNFYKNLSSSGYFNDVTLGRTFEVKEGVSFSLTAKFATPGGEVTEPESVES